MKELYDFLKIILKTPGMFGVSKIEDINFVVLGHSSAKKDMGISEFFGELNDHIKMKYSMKNTAGWCKILRFYSASDGHSLKLFEENLDELYEKKGLSWSTGNA